MKERQQQEVEKEAERKKLEAQRETERKQYESKLTEYRNFMARCPNTYAELLSDARRRLQRAEDACAGHDGTTMGYCNYIKGLIARWGNAHNGAYTNDSKVKEYDRARDRLRDLEQESVDSYCWRRGTSPTMPDWMRDEAKQKEQDTRRLQQEAERKRQEAKATPPAVSSATSEKPPQPISTSPRSLPGNGAEGKSPAAGTTPQAVRANDPPKPPGKLPGRQLPGDLDTKAGEFIFQHKKEISAAALSPDGRFLITGSEDEIRIHDTATGQQRHTLPLDARPTHLSFSTDSQWILIATFNGVLVKELAHGVTLRTWQEKEGGVETAFFLPDGRDVLICGSRQIRVVDGVSSTIRATYKKSLIGGCALTPDGKWLVYKSSSALERLAVPQLNSGRPLGKTYFGNSAIAISPDGSRFLAYINDNELALRNTADGEIVQQWKAYMNPLFSPNGQHIFSKEHGGNMPTLRRTTDGDGAATVLPLSHEAVYAAAFTPDDRWIVTGSGYTYSGTLVFSSTKTGKAIQEWSLGKAIGGIVVSADGKKLLVTAAEAAYYLNMPTLSE